MCHDYRYAHQRARWVSCVEYVSLTPAVRDVTISGGDASMLSGADLRFIGDRLLDIPHVQCVSLRRCIDLSCVIISLCCSLSLLVFFVSVFGCSQIRADCNKGAGNKPNENVRSGTRNCRRRISAPRHELVCCTHIAILVGTTVRGSTQSLRCT